MKPTIAGFEYRRVAGAGASLNVAVAGQGPPVVLLHGFPETHLAWREVAPRLARRYRVACPDLRGYGDSEKPPSDEGHLAYSKRTMAADVRAMMKNLGAERFSVVGHDRGGLVAFRAALDHVEAIERVVVMDVLPTVDTWASLAGPAGIFAFHLYLLAQPTALPERLIGG